VAPVPIEPLAALLTAGPEGDPRAVVARAARALLDLPQVPPVPPPWLASHQRPAAIRLTALVERYGGALLADAPGLGKSYVALAVALMRGEPLTLVVPAVLVGQWRALCRKFAVEPPIVTHESLSRVAGATGRRGSASAAEGGVLIVDEAHHFRNPDTRRYRALARMAIGNPVLLITATPVHNGVADLVHLLRLFLRDDALAGLGVPSLKRSATGENAAALPAALARLVVARSRARAPALALPRRARGEVIRVGPAPDSRLAPLVEGIEALAPGPAGALIKIVLLSRLASSLRAFRDTLSRQRAFADFAEEARRTGRSLSRADFRRLFPRGEEPDLQLALLPLLLPEGVAQPPASGAELESLARLAEDAPDPKLRRLDELLRRRPGKTIVFTTSRATARQLVGALRARHRVAAVMGARGLLPTGPAPVTQVLRAFAPLATGAPLPPRTLTVDVLVATDLASEGLNLQDAIRVVHYDLPWTAARLAQRVGRIDRLGSPHSRVETVSFLPPLPVARALRLEERLLRKSRWGRRAGAAGTESAAGRTAAPGPFDWCDRLQALAGTDAAGAACAVPGEENCVVLVVAIGASCEATVVRPAGVTTDPPAAVRILEAAAASPAIPLDVRMVRDAVVGAAPLVRRRIAAIAASRWRAGDRDQLSRRLIPMVVTEARRAARAADAPRLTRLDALLARLGRGMTAGEEGALDVLLQDPAPLTADRLLSWHSRLPPAETEDPHPDVRLVAAIVVRASGRG